MKKIALLFICLNPPYWPYAKSVIEDCRKNFLPNHDVDYFLWSDLTKEGIESYKQTLLSNIQRSVEAKDDPATVSFFGEIAKAVGMYPAQAITQEVLSLKEKGISVSIGPNTVVNFNGPSEEVMKHLLQSATNMVNKTYDGLDSIEGMTVVPTEPAQWPLPTLMRYHLFLQKEDVLKDYDYIFYMDLDMRVVGEVGDEILGPGLTAALHPMYAFKPGLRFPLEPNPDSSAYIKIPEYYFAGGFQGGPAEQFIKSMWTMRRGVDRDFTRNYVARWNDESHWNRYLFDNPPSVILSPSYVYPDSLIKEYYEPIWGRSYIPKIITLTKPFSISKEGGDAVRKWIDQGKV